MESTAGNDMTEAESPLRAGARRGGTDPVDRRVVHRWAVATVACTFLLILAGALVTSRDAGLAVPDWPLSFGTVNPPQWYAIENVRTEHGHRVIAGGVALLTVLMALTVRRREKDPRIRKLAALAVLAVLFQAMLGGLRVLHLSIDLAMVHGCMGQIFLCIGVALATMTSPRWTEPSRAAAPARALTSLCAILPAVVLCQLVMGVVIRHNSLLSVSEFLTQPLLIGHILTALAVAVLTLMLFRALRSESAAGGLSHAARRSRLLAGLVIAQIATGLAAVVITSAMAHDRQATILESWIPTLHVAIGAAILSTSVVIALHVLVRSPIVATARDSTTDAAAAPTQATVIPASTTNADAAPGGGMLETA